MDLKLSLELDLELAHIGSYPCWSIAEKTPNKPTT
jgi:hypothetical protein